MPMLPRTSLVASIVCCPSTPFLVPRLVRTPAPLARALLYSRCSYATEARGERSSRSGNAGKGKAKAKAKGKSSTPLRFQAFRKRLQVEPNADLRAQLRAACEERNVDTIQELYPDLVHLRALDANDTRRIAQAMHYHIRSPSIVAGGIDLASSPVFPFAMQMVEDIQTGALPPQPYAHVHLLGIFKTVKAYDQGHAFWQWLVDRDETYVSQAVYGAAIEMMAYGGKAILSDLEALYADALKRFPGTFAEYHLSPNAIVPDRTQPIALLSMPVLLHQGILTARIIAHDWKNSYLALDTGLRLFPTQLPLRYFELFLFERPLPEAYTTFLVACRAGLVLNSRHLTALLKKIRAAMTLSTSLHARTLLLRAMANAIYAYQEAGGSMERIHVGSVLAGFDELLPAKAPGETFRGEEAKIRDVAVTTAHGILSSLLAAGMPPEASTFAGLFTLAGTMHVPDLLKVSIQDCNTAGIPLGKIEVRTILRAAGHLGDKVLIEEYWSRLLVMAEARGESVNHKDWITLARACQRGQHVDFCREQMHKLDHTLKTSLKLNVIYEIENDELQTSEEPSVSMEPAAFADEMESLESQFKDITAVVMSGQPLDMRKTPFYMSLNPARRPLGTPKDMRIIYDEMTIDPHQPPAEVSPDNEMQPAQSSTGVPIAELRFQNWCSIVELMDQAQFWQDKRSPKMRAGAPVDIGKTYAEGFAFLGRSDQRRFPLPLDTLRQHIMTLRAPDLAIGAHRFRKVGGRVPITHELGGAPSAASQPFTEATQSSRPPPHSALSYRPKLNYATRKSSDEASDEVRTPSLRYYVGTESTHSAPSKLSRNPLQTRRRALKRHVLGLQAAPASEEVAGAAAGAAESSEDVKSDS